MNYRNSKIDVDIKGNDSADSSIPDFNIDYNRSFSSVSNDRSKPNFMTLASGPGSTDFAISYKVLRNGKEISPDDLLTDYPKIRFNISSNPYDVQYFGGIKFSVIDTLTKAEQDKYKGS
jgi:hypothetical protein